MPSSKRERKDRKRVNRACGGKAKQLQCISEDWSIEQVETHQARHKVADEMGEKLVPIWLQKLNDISKEQAAAMDPSKVVDEAVLLSLAPKTEAKTTLLLKEVKQSCVDNIGLEYPQDVAAAILPCYTRSVMFILPRIYLARAVARKVQGKFQEALVDATLGLDWSRHFKCKDPLAKPSLFDVELLYTRAVALEKGPQDLERAIQDYHAVHSAIHLHGEMGWHEVGGCCSGPYRLNLSKVLDRLLVARAEQKMQNATTRPHYTAEERGNISKQLGIGIYSKEMYKCGGCGLGPSNQVKLSLCSGCHVTWFCGKACLKRAWRKGHKSYCRNFLPEAVVSPEVRVEMEQNLASQGHAVIYNSFGPLVIVTDPSTGEIFDSLHDLDVVFANEDGHSPNCRCGRH